MINPQVFLLCICRPNVFIKLMTFFSLTFTSNIRFAWGIPRNTIIIIPLYHFLLLSSFMGLDGLVPSALCTHIPLAKTEIPTWEIEGMRSVAVFHCRAHKDYHECREEIPQRNKALSILVYNVYTVAVFARMLTGERSQVIWLLLLFSCTIERPCVCVTFCLTRSLSRSPFFIPSYRSLITLRSEPQ